MLTLHLHTPFAVALIAAALVPWLIGVVVGHFFRRLHGLILALATFALMEVVQVFFLNFGPTGAAQGMKGLPPLTELWQVWTAVLLLAVFFWRLRRSRIGRAMMAIKDDELVASALGISVARIKVIAFAAGAAVAGIGSGFYAHYAQYIQYSDFGADKAMAITTYAVFGGINTWLGGMLGAAVLSYMPLILQVFEHWRLEVHGAIILGVMAVRPQGVLERGLIADLRILWRRLRATVTGSGTRRCAVTTSIESCARTLLSCPSGSCEQQFDGMIVDSPLGKRAMLARSWPALLVQTNGFGAALCASMKPRIPISSSARRRCTPRRLCLFVSSANQLHEVQPRPVRWGQMHL